MSNFGILVIGNGLLDSSEVSYLNYHVADRNGRLYLCNCRKSFRIGNEVKYVRHKIRKMTMTEYKRKLNTDFS